MNHTLVKICGYFLLASSIFMIFHGQESLSGLTLWAFTLLYNIAIGVCLVSIPINIRRLILQSRPSQQVRVVPAVSTSPAALKAPSPRTPESFQEPLATIRKFADQTDPELGGKLLRKICKNVTALFSRPNIDHLLENNIVMSEEAYSLKLRNLTTIAESIPHLADKVGCAEDLAAILVNLQSFNNTIEADLKKADRRLGSIPRASSELLND